MKLFFALSMLAFLTAMGLAFVGTEMEIDATAGPDDNLAGLAHLLVIFTGLIGIPLIILSIVGSFRGVGRRGLLAIVGLCSFFHLVSAFLYGSAFLGYEAGTGLLAGATALNVVGVLLLSAGVAKAPIRAFEATKL